MPTAADTTALATYLLGEVDFHRCLALQQRLVYELAGRDDGQAALILCEHPPIVTVGRGGTSAAVRRQHPLLAGGRLAVDWVNRGGGAMLHLPGQLAIYPIVPLVWYGLRLGDYIARLSAAILAALADQLIVAACTDDGRVRSRAGELGRLGVAVRGGVAYYGAYLNVSPALGCFRVLETPADDGRASSVMAERRRPGTMNAVRSAVARRIADCLGAADVHLHTGHPWL